MLKTMLLLMKHIRELDKVLPEIAEIVLELERTGQLDSMDAIIYYIIGAGASEAPDILYKHLTEKARGEMETIAQYFERIGEERGEKRGEKRGEERGEKRGEERGRKEGERLGKEQGFIKTACNMIKADFNFSTIAKITGLSIAKIQQLADKLTESVD